MTITSLNPHDPTDVVGEWEPTDARGVDAAVARARAAANGWRSTPAGTRGKALADIADALETHADEIVRLTVREVGKPVTEARGEVARAVSIFRYYAQIVLAPDGQTLPAADPDAWLIARRYPLGVCVLITPWNFPVAIPVWKLAPAIGYGNAVLMKAASAGTAVATRLYEIASAHLPDDVFQLVHGDGTTGRALVEHPDVAAVSFTGSVPVGMDIARRVAERGARVQCEMGGQNPSIVLGDADLDRAATMIAYASMGCAGQKCTATSRVIVEEPVYDAFRDRLIAAVDALQVLDPADERTLVGPVIDDGARAQALQAVERSGGRVLTGGTALDGAGFYLAPTLVELEEPSGPLAKEEVFAPVAAVIKASSPEAAVDIGNDVRFGLVASIFTSDLRAALTLTNRVEAGLIRVNAPTSGVDFHAPFGGSKGSSIGPREQGLAARDFYTESRTLLIVP